MRSRFPLIVTGIVFMLFLSLMVRLSIGKALQVTEKPNAKSQAQRCLEENIKSGGKILPCVGSDDPPSGPSSQPPPSTTGMPSEKNLIIGIHGYKTGYFLHPEALRFCNLLSEEIHRNIMAGKNVKTIIITGQADGQVNPGIHKGREIPTPKCRQIVRGETINDKDLARLRGCVIWNLLSDGLTKQKIGIAFGWDKDRFSDIDDGGPSQDTDRKVTVEVVWQ